jgi:hypothetical protein
MGTGAQGCRALRRLAVVLDELDATVYVSRRPDMPGVLLFSRVPLSGPQGKGGSRGS